MIRTMKFKRCLALVISLMMILSSAVTTFAAGDVAGHWAEEDINYLISKNLVQGDDNGDIRPDANITRAEFVTVVNRIYGYSAKASSNYPDVSSSAWYADQLLIAKAQGYLTGDENGNANPDQMITRAEVSVIVARIMNLSTSKTPNFTDAAEFPAWASGAIAALADEGLIAGYADGSFGANALITRAEAFVIFARVVKGQASTDNPGNIIGPGYGGGGSSGGSSGGGGGTVAPSVSKPTIVRANPELGIDWTSVNGATSYTVSITSVKTGVETKYTSFTTHFDVEKIKDEILPPASELEAKVTYTVKVMAVGSYGNSAYSDPTNLVFTFPSMPQVTNVSMKLIYTAVSENFLVTWDAVADATGYQVKVKNGETTYIDTTVTTTEVDVTDIIKLIGMDKTLTVEIQTLSDIVIDSEVLSVEVSLSGANVDFAGGSGTVDDPYQIYNARHFENLRKDTTKHYVVKGSFTLPDDFVPIPDFSGTLIGDMDGEMPTITVNINMPDGLNVGLFAQAGNATIQNIQLDGTIVGKAYVGGFVGYSGATSVIGCINTADIRATNTGGNSNVGGIIGNVNGNAVIKDCVNFGTIDGGTNRNTGGIFGYSTNSPELLVENCENNGEIKSVSPNVGGIAGYMNYGHITKCRNNGSVTAGNEKQNVGNVGGIAGANYDRLDQCYNTGKVTGDTSATGGIIGSNSGAQENVWANNNYNIGEVNQAGIIGGSGQQVKDSNPPEYIPKIMKFNYTTYAATRGPFSSVLPGVDFEGNYFLDNAKPANEYATALTDEEMKDLANFAGFDPAIWTIGEVEDYPYPTLKNNPHKAPDVLLEVLETPSQIEVAEADGVYTVSFTGDSNAVKHKIDVVFNGATTNFETADGATTSVDITKALAAHGKYTITVTSIGDGVAFKNSLPASISYDVIDPESVGAPTGLSVTWGGATGAEDKYTLTFKAGTHAAAHDVTILKVGSDVPVTISDVTGTSVDLTEYIVGVDNEKVGAYSVTVTAKRDDVTANSIAYTIDSAFGGTVQRDGETFQIVGCLRHLKNVKATGNYLQVADITEPLTTPFEKFAGKYIGDGDTQKVVTLAIEDMETTGVVGEKGTGAGSTGVGMFRVIDGPAVIENIHSKGTVKGKQANGVGAIVGTSTSGKALQIRNCVNSAAVTKTEKQASGAGTEGTGGIIGNQFELGSTGAVIENCVNYGSISAVSYAGGIVGYNRCLVTNCTNEGAIAGNNSGGISGANYGKITRSRNIVDLNAASFSTVGGIAGAASGGGAAGSEDVYLFEECYNTGNITAKGYTAGIVGNLQAGSVGSNYGMRNCYNIGLISDSATSGGLVGQYGRVGRSGPVRIDSCYDAQEKTMSLVGAIAPPTSAGEATDELEFTASYYRLMPDAETEGLEGTGGKTLEEIKALVNDAAFNASKAWVIAEGFDLPQLKNNPHVTGTVDPGPDPDPDPDPEAPAAVKNLAVAEGETGSYAVTFDPAADATEYEVTLTTGGGDVVVTGDAPSIDLTGKIDTSKETVYTVSVKAKNGSASSEAVSIEVNSLYGGAKTVDGTVYQIVSQLRHLNNVKDHLDGDYLQTKDIDTGDNFLNVYRQAGGTAGPNEFVGKYIGEGDERKVIDLNITDGTSANKWASVFGRIGGDALIQNIKVTGTVIGADKLIGAIAGEMTGNAVIDNCENAAAVSNSGTLVAAGANIGGITGSNAATNKITNCVNSGSVTSTSTNVGGIIGYANGPVTGCVNTGSVTVNNLNNTGANSNVGGIVGYASVATATVSDSKNSGHVTNIFPETTVTANASLALYTGGIVGNARGNVTGCTNEGTGVVEFHLPDGMETIGSGQAALIGGVVGYLYSNTAVSNCKNYGKFIAEPTNLAQFFTGGIVGSSYGTISLCANYYNMDGPTSTARQVGGIAGRVSDGSISECYNMGKIWTNGYSGGIAARIDSAKVVVENCYNVGQIQGSNSGGLVGTGSATLKNSYSHQPAKPNSHAIIRNPSTVTAEKLYYQNHEGIQNSIQTGTTALEAADLSNQAKYVGFDFENVWTIKAGFAYPQLINNPHPAAEEPEPGEDDLSDKTVANVKITTENDVYSVSFDALEGVDKYEISILKDGAADPVKLETTETTKDITDTVLGAEAVNAGKYTVTVVGKNDSSASQASAAVVLDSRFGGGTGTEADPYQIANLRHFYNIDADAESKAAHYLQTADLTITGEHTPICVDFANRFTGTYRGKQDLDNGVKYRTVTFENVTASAANFGLFGVIDTAAIVEFIGIEGSMNTAFNHMGSIAYQSSGTIRNCYSSADMTSTEPYCGGIVSDNRGLIENCYTTGNISAATHAAGIAAIVANGNRNVRISKCFATGDISASEGQYYAAGILGDIGASTNASSNLRVTIEDCYFTGMIDTPDVGRTGGILGRSANCDKEGEVEVILRRTFTTNNGYANKIYGYGLSGKYKEEKKFTAPTGSNFYLAGGTEALYNRGTELSADEFKNLIDRNFGTSEAPAIHFPSSVWVLKPGFDFPQLISNPHVGE